MPLARVLGQHIGDFRGEAGLNRVIGDRYTEPAGEGLLLGGRPVA